MHIRLIARRDKKTLTYGKGVRSQEVSRFRGERTPQNAGNVKSKADVPQGGVFRRRSA